MISQYLLISLKTVQTSQSAYTCCQKATADNSSCCQKANTAGYYGIHFRYCTENSQNQTSQSHSTGKDSTWNSNHHTFHSSSGVPFIKSQHLLFCFLLLNSLTFLLLFTFPPALFFKFFCFIAVYPGITGLTVSGSKYIIQTIFNCLASGIYSRIYCAVNSLSHRLLNILGHLAVIFSRNCCVYDFFYLVPKLA